MKKEISLIVPLYNVEQYVRRCLDSIVAQTVFQQMEIILVDDGSKDDSGKICDEYTAKHENVITIHKSNGGVSSARNSGLEIASGKYLAYVDADDYIAPDMYEVLLTRIYEEKADMAIVDFFVCFPDGTKIKKRNANGKMAWTREEAISSLLSGKHLGINIFDKIISREKTKKIYFKEGKSIGEDMFYMLEVLLKMNKVCADFSGKYFYEKREGSAMISTFSEKYFDTLYFSERMIDEIKGKLPELLPQAKAHLIHEQCKTVERMYLLAADGKYAQQKKELLTSIKEYQVLDAYKNLSKKQFCGVMLMRISPKFYIKLLKMMKIE